jgi:hypothetical protein
MKESCPRTHEKAQKACDRQIDRQTEDRQTDRRQTDRQKTDRQTEDRQTKDLSTELKDQTYAVGRLR